MQIGECNTQNESGMYINIHKQQIGEVLQIGDTHMKTHYTKWGRHTSLAFKTYFSLILATKDVSDFTIIFSYLYIYLRAGEIIEHV